MAFKVRVVFCRSDSVEVQIHVGTFSHILLYNFVLTIASLMLCGINSMLLSSLFTTRFLKLLSL
jgi:hypothetical protein